MKDSQDWLDEILERCDISNNRVNNPLTVEHAKSAIREHFLKEALELETMIKLKVIAHANPMFTPSEVGAAIALFANDVIAELRNKFNDKYKED